MLTNLQVVYLSILQGITEFLPVSSSGHLILLSKFTNFPDQGLILDVAVHFGSILAVMIYFSNYIYDMLVGLWKTRFLPNFKNENAKLFWLLIFGTFPIVIAGLLLEKYGTEFLRSPKLVGWTILLYGLLLFVADTYSMTIRKINHLGLKDAFLIGLAQCLSLIPGTSRSGITITMARFLGMERTEAAKFSMLLSIPAIFGATILVCYEAVMEGTNMISSLLLNSITYSFTASIVAIYIVMKWLKKSTFLPFVIYRIILGSYLLLDSYGYLNKWLD